MAGGYGMNDDGYDVHFAPTSAHSQQRSNTAPTKPQHRHRIQTTQQPLTQTDRPRRPPRARQIGLVGRPGNNVRTNRRQTSNSSDNHTISFMYFDRPQQIVAAISGGINLTARATEHCNSTASNAPPLAATVERRGLASPLRTRHSRQQDAPPRALVPHTPPLLDPWTTANRRASSAGGGSRTH
jgi:hypothetical protein